MKKGIVIILNFLLIGFIVSCCETVTHPYYDFKSFSINISELENDSVNQSTMIGFTIKLEEHTLYSQTKFSLFNSAYATQPCPVNGNEGLKFPIVEMKVTCNQTFFDTIPANTDISHLFYARNYSDSIVYLDDLEVNQYLMSFGGGINSFLPQLYLNNNNLLGVEHIFNFSIKKSNEEIISNFSEPVIW